MKNKSFITEKCGTNTPPDKISIEPPKCSYTDELNMEGLAYQMDLKEYIDDIKAPKTENLVIYGKLYKGGKAISQAEYDKLKQENKLDKDTYYLIKPNIDYKLYATKKWCSVSNAIIKKYKNMVEFDDEDIAVVQLKEIKYNLIKLGYLKDNDFEDWGEE